MTNTTTEQDDLNIRRIVNGLILGEISIQEAADGIVWVHAEQLQQRIDAAKQLEGNDK